MYGNLSDYSIGISVPWCNETGNMGFLLYGAGSGDKQYRLNFTQGEKTLRIYTGSNSEIIEAQSRPVTDINYLTLPGGSRPMGIVYDGVETVYTASFYRGSIIAINTSTLEYEEYFIRGSVTNLATWDLTIDADGNVWFSLQMSPKIGRFNTTDKTFKEFAIPGETPHGIVYNPFDGNVWFASPPCSPMYGNECLCKINPSSEEMTCYYGGFRPTLLDLDSSGNIWFTDSKRGDLHMFDISTGDLLNVTGFDRPFGLFVDGDLVYVAENSQPLKDPDYQYDKNGTIAIYNIITEEISRVNTAIITNEGPYMPNVDSYGNLWFTDNSNHMGRVGYSNGSVFVEKAIPVINDVGTANYFMTQMTDKMWFSGEGSDYMGIVDTGEFFINSDDDGITDEDDNCPNDYNPDQTDADGDGIGDLCDICPYDAGNDLDEDGACDDIDNCPYVTNIDQSDIDSDGLGDACDDDDDNDEILDLSDACPLVYGKPEYEGCPVGDDSFVELHVIDRQRTVCGGSGSCKLPVEGALVKVFDRNDPAFQDLYTKNPDRTSYPDIFEDYTSVGTCVTGSDGSCIAGEEAVGDYLVIVKYVDEDPGEVVYTGKPKSRNDFVDTDGDGIDDLAYKDFQIIKVIDKDGNIDFKAGSKTIVTGSVLEVIYPQYTIWESEQELYPFIFTSDSDWAVDVCVYVPEGYVVVEGDCTQVFVSGETKDIIFTVVETNSPPPHVKTKIKTKHNGRAQTVNLDIPGKWKDKKEKDKYNGMPFVLAGMLGLTTVGFIKKRK